MNTPKRIQRKRTKGWKMPEGAVSVCRPGKFGNPFPVDSCMEACGCSKEEAIGLCVDAFRGWLRDGEHSEFWFTDGIEQHEKITASLHELKGKDLACFCALDQPCHADVLIELANEVNP